MRTSLYYLINLANNSIVSGPQSIPPELNGLADETLADLTPLAGAVPQYSGYGFWPQDQLTGSPASQNVNVSERVVYDTVPSPPPPPNTVEYNAVLRRQAAELERQGRYSEAVYVSNKQQ